MAQQTYNAPALLDRFQRNGLIAAAIGFVLTLLSIILVSPTQFFHSWLLGFLVFLGLSAGSLALLMLQYVSGGAWGVVARRIFEAGSRLLPFAALLFIPVILGMHDIYRWTDPNEVAKSAIISDKTGYLNTPFWIVRAIVYFAFWITVATVLSRYSKNMEEAGMASDDNRAWKWSRKLENFSGGGLLFFAILMSLAAVDWLMSLAPEWYSTIYGFIILVGQGIIVMCFAIIVLVLVSRTEPMASVIKPVHLHDLGKLLFAFNFLWGYLEFSQWIITYSGNLPDEIVWYHHRIRGGWEYVAYLVIFLHFAIPFAILLSRDLKRNGRRLIIMAGWLFIMRIVDLYWLIEPNWHREEFFFSWVDIAAPLGFVGLFVYLFVWQYKKRQIMPIGEPEFELALHPKGAH
ncbi:MAG TPA: hypothetical protein VG537_05000 [Candidatus Kapabacteria bacterium]|nr:hypothetical protein [Candidatus Kapabacteria bacterium]